MKKYIRMRIGGQEVDLPNFKELPFRVSFRVSEDGAVAASSSRRPIALPASKRNIAIFQSWHDAGSVNPNAVLYKDCICEADGIPIFVGKCRLSSSEMSNQNKYFRYSDNLQIELYGNNADWFFAIKDLFLRELDFGSVAWTIPNIILGTTAVYSPALAFGFCLIKWKEWNTLGQVSYPEYSPFLFVRSILDKIVLAAGYTLNSTFFNSDNFKRLIMPLAPESTYPQEWADQYTNVKAAETINQIIPSVPFTYNVVIYDTLTQTPAANPTAYNTGTGQYTVLENGFYNFIASVELIAILPNTPTLSKLGILVNTVLVAFTPTTGIYVNERLTIQRVLQLNAGDIVEIGYLGFHPTTSTLNNGTLEIQGQADAKFGSTLYPNFLCKDWKAKDFLAGLTHAFNLVWEADIINNVLVCEPADSYQYTQRNPATTQINDGFYLDTESDKTLKIDLSKTAELNALQDGDRTEVLAWISDDATTQAIDANNTLGVFSAQYQHPTGRYNDTINIVENPFFAKTISLFDNTIAEPSVSGVVPLVPLIYPSSYFDNIATETSYDYQPRLLYFYGIRGLLVDGAVNFGGGAYTAMPACFFVNYNDTTGLDPSLSFADELFNNIQPKGLLWRYYLTHFTRRTLGKEAREFLFFRDIDILGLTFRNKILVSGNSYILQEVKDYNTLSESSTEVVMLYDKAPSPAEEARITNMLLSGFLTN